MALKEITNYEEALVLNAADRLTGDADENKMVFDRLAVEHIIPGINDIVKALTAESGASEVGAKVQGVAGGNVQELLAGLKAYADDLAFKSGTGIISINGKEEPNPILNAEDVGATPTTYYKTITTGAEWNAGETESVQGIDVTGLTVNATTRMDVMTSSALLTAMQDNGVSAVFVRTRPGGAELVCMGGSLPEGVEIELNIVEVKQA